MMLLMLSLLSSPSLAQEVTLTGVEVTNYNGFKATDGADAPLYWNFAEFYSERDGRLHIVSPDLKVAQPIFVPRGYVAGGVRSGERAWFWVAKGKELTLVQTDVSGKELGRVERPILRGAQNRGAPFPTEDGSVVLVMPQKLSAAGVRVERLGPNRASQWTMDIVPPKGALKIRALAGGKDRVVMVIDNKSGVEIAAVSKDGNLLYRTEIDSGSIDATPRRLAVHPDGHVAIFTTPELEGLDIMYPGLKSVLTIISPDGKSQHVTDLFSGTIKGEVNVLLRRMLELKDEVPDPPAGDVYVSGLHPTDTGFRVVAEVIHMTPDGAPPPNAVKSNPWELAFGQKGTLRSTGVLIVDVDTNGSVTQARVIDTLDRRTKFLVSDGSNAGNMARKGERYDRLAFRFPVGEHEVLLNESGNRYTVDLVNLNGIAMNRRIQLDKRPDDDKGDTKGPVTRHYRRAVDDSFHQNGLLYEAQVFPSAKEGHVVVVTTAPGPPPERAVDARTYNITVKQVSFAAAAAPEGSDEAPEAEGANR